MNNNEEIYQYIQNMYLSVYGGAIDMGLKTDNICIYMRSYVKKSLALGKFLTICYKSLVRKVPVIADDDIPEEEKEGSFQSNIYIYDPNWAEIE